MIKTGVKGIDELIGGGIPQGSRVLYCLEPGVDGQLFMINTLTAALKGGKRCLLIAPHISREIFRQDVLQLNGFDIGTISESLFILDIKDRIEYKKNVDYKEGKSSILGDLINKYTKDNNIDAIFIYADIVFEDFGISETLELLSDKNFASKITIILEYLNLEGSKLLDELMNTGNFQLVISVNSGYSAIPFFDFFTLEYIAWNKMPKRAIPYYILNGEVIPYIPKIVVIGPAGSGKSTFVANGSDCGSSTDRIGTTVAMDLGWLHWRGFEISLYGTPGQPRFDPIIPQIMKKAMGAVLLVDAQDPLRFERAKEQIVMIESAHIPLIIVGNKSDLPNSVDKNSIRNLLSAREDIEIVTISSNRPQEVRGVIERLVDRITLFPLT